MKQLVKTSRAVGLLEKIYRQLNIDKFGGELEEPVITIQSSPRAYGHVTYAKVWQAGNITRYELNIGAETINRPIEDVVGTLLHEMVHIYNLMHGIQDCSRGNTYHNKRFKIKAESVGLVINYDKRIGWSITSPSEELIDYIIAQGWQDILIARSTHTCISSPGINTPGEKSRTNSTRKYICPCCGMSVRATKQVNILCGDCGETMQTA